MSGTIDVKNIRALLEILEKHDVSEFRIETGEQKISLKRGDVPPGRDLSVSGGSGTYPAVTSAHVTHHTHTHSSGLQEAVSVSTPSAPPAAGNGASPDLSHGGSVAAQRAKNVKDVVSPMVGTFYRRPAVDAEPYVEVGDPVKKGDVLCIVEAMKLMNEIESDITGRIVEVCLEDGQMVEYGEVLFRIETSA